MGVPFCLERIMVARGRCKLPLPISPCSLPRAKRGCSTSRCLLQKIHPISGGFFVRSAEGVGPYMIDLGSRSPNSPVGMISQEIHMAIFPLRRKVATEGSNKKSVPCLPPEDTHGEGRDVIFHAIPISIDIIFLFEILLIQSFLSRKDWWGAGAKPLQSPFYGASI